MCVNCKVPSRQEYKRNQDGNRRLSVTSTDRVPNRIVYTEHKKQSERQLFTLGIARRERRQQNTIRIKRAGRTRALPRNTSKPKSTIRKQLIILLMMTVQPVHSHKIKIQLTRDKNFFGKDVQLVCSYEQSPGEQINLVQWLKGDSELLTFGDSSENNNTYIPNLVQIENIYFSTLTIRNFTSYDLNTYICQFNFKTTSLLLDRTTFAYIPTDKEIIASIVNENSTERVMFTINMVFPEPSCNIYMEIGKEQTELKVQSQFLKSRILYRIAETAYLPETQTICEYMIVLNCTVFDVHFNSSIWKNRTNCQSIPETDDEDISTWIVVSVLICIAIAAIIFIRFKCLKSMEDLTYLQLLQMV